MLPDDLGDSVFWQNIVGLVGCNHWNAICCSRLLSWSHGGYFLCREVSKFLDFTCSTRCRSFCAIIDGVIRQASFSCFWFIGHYVFYLLTVLDYCFILLDLSYRSVEVGLLLLLFMNMETFCIKLLVLDYGISCVMRELSFLYEIHLPYKKRINHGYVHNCYCYSSP